MAVLAEGTLKAYRAISRYPKYGNVLTKSGRFSSLPTSLTQRAKDRDPVKDGT